VRSLCSGLLFPGHSGTAAGGPRDVILLRGKLEPPCISPLKGPSSFSRIQHFVCGCGSCVLRAGIDVIKLSEIRAALGSRDPFANCRSIRCNTKHTKTMKSSDPRRMIGQLGIFRGAPGLLEKLVQEIIRILIGPLLNTPPL
jgi:hypothetical protein